MKQAYIIKRFKPESLLLIKQSNDVINSYLKQGYKLTVRQLYYQLVAKDIIPNTLEKYKAIAELLNNARMAGVMDWDAIEDRTRRFITRPAWKSGKELFDIAASQFHADMWDNQEGRVYVIIEKEALVGVLERTCREYDVPLLAARGYPSVSVIRDFYHNTMADAMSHGQRVTILHLGDHDPSGIDMTRDLEKRLGQFDQGDFEGQWEVRRIALSMDQIEETNPPPNPAKETDARFKEYEAIYGDKSWELDALTPAYINNLVEVEIESEIDEDNWRARKLEIETIKNRMKKHAAAFRD